MCSESERLKGHLVLLALPAWGAVRPLCGVACKAIQERPDIMVTFMTLGAWDERITAECDRYTRSNSDREKEDMRRRMRLVNIGGQGFDIPELMSAAFKSFPDCYQKLVLCESIRCMYTGDDIPSTICPTVVITDTNYLPIAKSIREISGRNVPIWNCWLAGAFIPLRLFGPEKYGGLGDVANKARHVAEATGQDLEQVTKEMTNMKQGSLVVLPGLPAFYDYEWYPIPVDRYKELPVSFYDVFEASAEFMQMCDAFIYNTTGAYESEAVDATRQWLKESGGRKLYAIGPILPWSDTILENPNHGLLATDDELSEYGTQVPAFMDRILASHGENSLLFISFGTLWWPEGNYIRLYVEILLEYEIPFIFATASPYADLSAELIKRVSDSGFAMISKWCQQQTILSHPVTGWFLSHCGHNSTIEALSRGIPIIAWPLVFDQPGNAAYISLSLDVAFELIQVRTGAEGLKRLHRASSPPVGTCKAVAAEARDVLRRIKGSEGERKRRNAEGVRDRLGRAWMKSGDGLEDFKRLLCDATKE